MTIETQSFCELMQRVRQGETEALRVVLEEYGDAIRREVRFTLLDARLRRFVGESDVYQSVVIRFISGMRDGNFRIEAAGDLTHLLKGIARTRIAELVRYWHAQKRNLARNVNLTHSGHAGVSVDGRRPQDIVSCSELAELAAKKLPPSDLQILAWRDEGLNWSEIASRLGAVSGEAARKRHERSLATVAEQLDEDCRLTSRKTK